MIDLHSIFKKFHFHFCILAICLCTGPSSVFAQGEAPLAKSIFWQISGPKLSKPSYLYGTMHVLPAKQFYWPKNFHIAWKKTQQVVFEIDLDEAKNIFKQVDLLFRCFMKDGLTLKEVATPEQYKIIHQYLESKGFSNDFMEKMKPLLLSMVVEGIDMSGGGGAMTGSEMEINKRAEKKDIPTYGLESMKGQLGYIDSISYSDQAAFLAASIQSKEQSDISEEVLLKYYLDQDIEALHRLIHESDQEDMFSKYLLEYRNKDWIQRMEAFMQEGGTLFAVGAGHLAGPKGVIRLLRAKGYAVRPL